MSKQMRNNRKPTMGKRRDKKNPITKTLSFVDTSLIVTMAYNYSSLHQNVGSIVTGESYNFSFLTGGKSGATPSNVRGPGALLSQVASTTTGLFTNWFPLKARVKVLLTNNEAFSVFSSFTLHPAGQTTGTNFSADLTCQPSAVVTQLAVKNTSGSSKTINRVIDIQRLQGIDFLALTNIGGNISAGTAIADPSIMPLFHLQEIAQDGASVYTITNGVAAHVNVWLDVILFNRKMRLTS